MFNVALLAARLADVTGWLRSQPEVGAMPIGYFGASWAAPTTPCSTSTGRHKKG